MTQSFLLDRLSWSFCWEYKDTCDCDPALFYKKLFKCKLFDEEPWWCEYWFHFATNELRYRSFVDSFYIKFKGLVRLTIWDAGLRSEIIPSSYYGRPIFYLNRNSCSCFYCYFTRWMYLRIFICNYFISILIN